MVEFRKMSTVIRELRGTYWMNNDGEIWREQINQRFTRDSKQYRFKTRVRKIVEDMDTYYIKTQLEGYDFVILHTGELLRKLQPYTDSNPLHNYSYYSLYNVDNSRKVYRKHRLVVEMFVKKLENNEIVHHLDHDKTNNKLDNLLAMDASDHTRYHVAFTNRQVDKYSKILRKYGV